MSESWPSYTIHKHRCPGCGWNWTCTCREPDEHHGFCFECAAKASSVPVEAKTTPPTTPTPPPDENSRLWASWGVRP